MSAESKSWSRRDRIILAAWFIPAAALTWPIHEIGHYLAGIFLGYEMWVSLNQAGLVEGSYQSVLDQWLVAMAGPAVTWVQGVVGYLAARWSRDLWVYSFVFLSFWMRAVAVLISLVAKPNDEAAASLLMGLPMLTLPLVSIGFLLVLTYFAAAHLNAGWKENLTAYVAASVVTSAVVWVDQVYF